MQSKHPLVNLYLLGISDGDLLIYDLDRFNERNPNRWFAGGCVLVANL